MYMYMYMYTYMHMYVYTGQEVDGMPAIFIQKVKNEVPRSGEWLNSGISEGFGGSFGRPLGSLDGQWSFEGLSWGGSRRSLGCPGHSPGALWKW